MAPTWNAAAVPKWSRVNSVIESRTAVAHPQVQRRSYSAQRSGRLWILGKYWAKSSSNCRRNTASRPCIARISSGRLQAALLWKASKAHFPVPPRKRFVWLAMRKRAYLFRNWQICARIDSCFHGFGSCDRSASASAAMTVLLFIKLTGFRLSERAASCELPP